MATVDDQASEIEALHLQVALQNQVTKAASQKLSPHGRCHSDWCRAAVPEGELFCDGDCRQDYEDIQAANKRNGRVSG